MGKTAFFFLLKDSRGKSSHGQMIHTELFLYEVSPISQLEKQFLFSEKTSIEMREFREGKNPIWIFNRYKL